MEAVRDFILGYRIWEVRDGKLHSLAVKRDEPWNAGINLAECSIKSSPPPHEAESLHHCGFNAFASVDKAFIYYKDYKRMFYADEFIYGAVAGAGKIYIHDKLGFRAEQMQILGLATPFLHRELSYNVEDAIERYRLPVFEKRKELSAWAESL